MHKLFALTFVLCLLSSAPAGAQTLSESGLETTDYKYVQVTIVLGQAAQAHKIGLTKDRIRNRVELRLRSLDLKVDDRTPPRNHGFLEVDITVGENAFGISLNFIRKGYFDARGQRYVFPVTTWEETTIGTHGGKVVFIINHLDQLLAAFLNEYLKANQVE